MDPDLGYGFGTKDLEFEIKDPQTQFNPDLLRIQSRTDPDLVTGYYRYLLYKFTCLLSPTAEIPLDFLLPMSPISLAAHSA